MLCVVWVWIRNVVTASVLVIKMVVFTKISLVVLSALSAVCTSESDHHLHKKPKSCSCNNKLHSRKADIENTSMPDTTPDVITTPDNKPENLSTAKTLADTDESNILDLNKSGLPTISLIDVKAKTGQGEFKLSSKKIRTSNDGLLTNQINLSPTDDAAFHKNWLINQFGNQLDLSPNHDQKFAKFSAELKQNLPLFPQEAEKHYYEFPLQKYNNYQLTAPQYTDIGKNANNPFNYIINQEYKIAPKIPEVSSQKNDYLISSYPGYRYETGSHLRLINNVKPIVNLADNQEKESSNIYPNLLVSSHKINAPHYNIQPMMLVDNNNNLNNNLKNIPAHTLEDLALHIPHDYDTLVNGQYISVKNIPQRPSVLQKPEKNTKWIKEKSSFINSYTGNEGSNYIDQTNLGHAVLQILSENGIYLTDNGKLMGPRGVVSNIQTLNLTPIVIGNTVTLSDILDGKYENEPSNMQIPSFHAILVTATHPIKILGIMPTGKTSPPLPLMDSFTNELSKYGPYKTKIENKPAEINTNSVENKEKLDTPVRNNDEQIIYNYEPKELSNPFSTINSNDNHLAWKHLGLSLGTGKTVPKFHVDDDIIHKNRSFSRLSELTKAEVASYLGKLFIPALELRNEPISILSRDASELLASKNIGANSNLTPDMSGLFDLTLRSDSVPLDVKTLLNRKADFTRSLAASSKVFGKIQNPGIATLGNYKLLQGGISTDGNKASPQRNFYLPAHEFSVSKLDPIYKPLFNRHTTPLDYMSGPNNNHAFNFLTEDFVSSRSGDDKKLPQIPPEINNGNNHVEVAENYDDNDGDFRIIGGNAATGSGTPLSNKGRSGLIF